MADAPQMNPIYTGLTQTDPNATGLGSMPIANMQPNQLAAMLFGMSQGATQAAQPSPYRQSPIMGLTAALQGASSGLGNYTSAQMAQQQFQIQAAKAAAEARTAQIGAASATRDFNMTNSALSDMGLGGGMTAGPTPTGSPAAGSTGGAPASGGGGGDGSSGDTSGGGTSSSPTIGGDITNPAQHVESTFHNSIGNTNDPAQLEAFAQKAFLIGGDKFTKMAEMARDKAKDIRQSALTTGRSLDARGQPMVTPQAATAMATSSGSTKAGENQQTPNIVMGPNGPMIAGVTQIPGSLQGISQRAFAQGNGDQSGKDASTLRTGGQIANDKARGETFGNAGLPLPQVGSMGPGGTPPAASRVVAPAPMVAPAIRDPGIVAPTNGAPAAPEAPGVPQVGTMGQPADAGAAPGVPQVGAMPPANLLAAKQAIARAGVTEANQVGLVDPDNPYAQPQVMDTKKPPLDAQGNPVFPTNANGKPLVLPTNLGPGQQSDMKQISDVLNGSPAELASIQGNIAMLRTAQQAARSGMGSAGAMTGMVNNLKSIIMPVLPDSDRQALTNAQTVEALAPILTMEIRKAIAVPGVLNKSEFNAVEGTMSRMSDTPEGIRARIALLTDLAQRRFDYTNGLYQTVSNGVKQGTGTTPNQYNSQYYNNPQTKQLATPLDLARYTNISATSHTNMVIPPEIRSLSPQDAINWKNQTTADMSDAQKAEFLQAFKNFNMKAK